MKTKIEIKSISGDVLFTHECEENSIMKTVKEALNKNANLRGADLRGADLRGANLRGANLYGADLIGANLYGADLYGADLIGANLYGADLSGANLYGADLRGTDLYGADLRGTDLYGADLRGAKNKESAKIPIFCKWSNSLIGDKIQIGCKIKSIEEWDHFFNSDKVYNTPRDTDDFKQIQAVFEAYKAYLTFLNK